MIRDWDADDVKYRLREAGDTLRRLPFPRFGAPPRGLRIAWPAIADDELAWLGYGANKASTLPARPEPQAIRRMDEALDWLLWLEGQPRMIVMARAIGVRWRRLESDLDLTERWMRMLERQAYQDIAGRLNKHTSGGSGNVASFARA